MCSKWFFGSVLKSAETFRAGSATPRLKYTKFKKYEKSFVLIYFKTD